MKDNAKPAKVVLMESLKDEAATLFCEDPDTCDALDQFSRNLLSVQGLIDRLTFIKQCAAERAYREAHNLPDYRRDSGAE